MNPKQIPKLIPNRFELKKQLLEYIAENAPETIKK